MLISQISSSFISIKFVFNTLTKVTLWFIVGFFTYLSVGDDYVRSMEVSRAKISFWRFIILSLNWQKTFVFMLLY